MIRRLTRLTYPRALLDVVLVLEEKDKVTHDTIARTTLPKWMRVVVVPKGSGVTTKPRALNYARTVYRHHAGFYREGAATLYVNPGLGTTGPPVRLGTWPEISLFRLRRAS